MSETMRLDEESKAIDPKLTEVNKKKANQENITADDEVEIYDAILPTSVAAKDESKDAMLKKLECED